MAINGKRAHADGATRDAWRAVGSIAAGTFLLATAEFLPIGLLSRLADDSKVFAGILHSHLPNIKGISS